MKEKEVKSRGILSSLLRRLTSDNEEAFSLSTQKKNVKTREYGIKHLLSIEGEKAYNINSKLTIAQVSEH